MPTPYLKKLADKGYGSLKELEKKWSKAKAIAQKEGRGDDYAYIVGIFKKMVGVKESFDGFEDCVQDELTESIENRIEKIVSNLKKHEKDVGTSSKYRRKERPEENYKKIKGILKEIFGIPKKHGLDDSVIDCFLRDDRLTGNNAPLGVKFFVSVRGEGKAENEIANDVVKVLKKHHGFKISLHRPSKWDQEKEFSIEGIIEI